MGDWLFKVMGLTCMAAITALAVLVVMCVIRVLVLGVVP